MTNTCNLNLKGKHFINLEDFYKQYYRNDEYIQVYQNSKSDGFFICKLTKK